MQTIDITDINIFSMRELTGNLSLLSTNEEIKDVEIILDKKSKEKLAKTLITRSVVRENQDLTINEIMVNKNHDILLQRGQSSFKQEGNKFVYTTESPNHARFKGDLKTIVSLKNDSRNFVCVQITLGNIDFDFSSALKEFNNDMVVYRNVKSTIYPGNYAISILED